MTYPILISQENFQAVTPQEFNDYLRADSGESDNTLNFFINTATNYLEIAARCSIIRKRYAIEFTNIGKKRTPSSHRLPMGHVDNLVAIEADGTLRNSAAYALKGDYIQIPNDHKTLKVTYDTGFDMPSNIPYAFKMAIMACAYDLFVHRVSSDIPANATPPAQSMVQYYGQLLKNYAL